MLHELASTKRLMPYRQAAIPNPEQLELDLHALVKDSRIDIQVLMDRQ